MVKLDFLEYISRILYHRLPDKNITVEKSLRDSINILTDIMGRLSNEKENIKVLKEISEEVKIK